jgi:putative ABC transport system permease protein
VAVYEKRAQFEFASISYPNFLDWQRDNRSLQSLAAFRPDDFSLTGLGEPQRLKGMMVSANFFPTLGVHPELGGGLDPGQDVLGGKPEAMISEGMWKTKFGSAPGVSAGPSG